jgi:hypothetical protein
MQWPTTELVFLLFPTLLILIKKRAAPDTHGLAISVIYAYVTNSISSMVPIITVIILIIIIKIIMKEIFNTA